MITLEQNSGINCMAGIHKFEFINIDSVKSILPTADSIRITLTNKPEKYSLKTKFMTVESKQIRNRMYQHYIEITFHGKNKNYNVAFDKLSNKRYIGIIYYNNDTTYVVGTMEEPLRFSFDDISDGKADGNTAYILRFECTATEPQIKLNQII